MAEISGIYLWILGLAIAVWITSDYLRGKHDLLSFRNLFLVGFILNQCHAPADTLFFDNWWGFKVFDKDAVGIECAFLTTVFVIVFAITYRLGWGAKGLASRIKIASFNPTSAQLMMYAVFITLLGAVARPGLHMLPKVMAILSYYTAISLAAIACGLVGWATGRHLKNPAYWFFGIGLVVLNLAIANSGWSRRPLAAVFAALIWGFYYSYWRYQRPAGVIAKLVAMSIVPLLIIASFSTIRNTVNYVDRDRSVGTIVNRMITEGDILEGLRRMSSGDACGPATLWCIENFPEQFSPKHLFSLRFFFMINVPRSIWPNKPEGTLSNEITTLIRMEGANRKTHSFGAGVIGYGAAEGGLYAVVVYAICLALFVRFFDNIVQANVLNPFVVVPMASGLGELVGIARGDMSLFANTLIIEVLFGTTVMLLVAWGTAPRGVPKRSAELGKNIPSQPPQRQVATVWVPAEWAATRQSGR